MNDDYSYVGVPATTHQAMANQYHDHPVESSETITLSGSEAAPEPKLSRPTVAWKSLITPIGTLILSVVLAVGHHIFNTLEDGKLVYNSPYNSSASVYNSLYNSPASVYNSTLAKSVVPQHWVTRISVGFSFGFKSAVGVTMGFVLLQCLWLSVVRQPLTIKEIDTMYRVERREQLYKTLPHAVLFSPTIVVFSALILLLPLSSVFAPGSLTVVTKSSTNVTGSCTIPTGNLSNFYQTPISFFSRLTTQCLVDQRIPDLPQVCGPNCRYTVGVPSFAFNCTPNPPSLPEGLVGGIWNGTMFRNKDWGSEFYISWYSSQNGTSGNASCSPFNAQYDIEVKTKGGVQSVTTSITEMTSPVPFIGTDLIGDDLWGRVAQVFIATATPFCTDAPPTLWPAGQPSFVEVHGKGASIFQLDFAWGDVLKGIEELSHNVSAALLTLPLGTMNSNCFFDLQDVVYKYSSFALWVPYGTALGIALISLIFSVMIMGRNNTGHITTSFSDTAILTKNVDVEVSAGAKLRLRAAEDGKLEYILEEINETSE